MYRSCSVWQTALAIRSRHLGPSTPLRSGRRRRRFGEKTFDLGDQLLHPLAVGIDVQLRALERIRRSGGQLCHRVVHARAEWIGALADHRRTGLALERRRERESRGQQQRLLGDGGPVQRDVDHHGRDRGQAYCVIKMRNGSKADAWRALNASAGFTGS